MRKLIKGRAQHIPLNTILLGLILLSGLSLRLVNLESESLAPLEIDWLRVSSHYASPVQGTIFEIQRRQGPIGPLMLNLLVTLGVREVWALRLPSVLFGTLAIYLTFLLGRDLYDERTGLIGATMIALMHLPLAYSQELRSYSLYLCLVLLSFIVFTRLEREPSKKLGQILLVVNLLLVLSHFFAFFVVIIEMLWQMVMEGGKKKMRWPKMWSLLPLLLAGLLLYITATGPAGMILNWGDCPAGARLDVPYNWYTSFVLGPAIEGENHLDPLWKFEIVPGQFGKFLFPIALIYLSLFMFGHGASIISWLRNRDKQTSFLLLALALPVIAMYLGLIVGLPPLVCYNIARRLMLLFPPLLLLAARGWIATKRFLPVAMGLFLFLSIPILIEYHTRSQQPPFEDAARIVESSMSPDAHVVLANSHFISMQYYFKGGFVERGIEALNPDEEIFHIIHPFTMDDMPGRMFDTREIWAVAIFLPPEDLDDLFRGEGFAREESEELVPGPIMIIKYMKSNS